MAKSLRESFRVVRGQQLFLGLFIISAKAEIQCLYLTEFPPARE
jgi:hypothetical protein